MNRLDGGIRIEQTGNIPHSFFGPSPVSSSSHSIFEKETEEALSRPPLPKSTARLPSPANDNGRAGKSRIKVFLPHDLPMTQAVIEVFARLLEELDGRTANDNEEQSK